RSRSANCRAKNRLRTVFNMPLLHYVGVLAAIGVFLAFLNPFGSVTEQPIGIAFAYWVPLIVYGGLAGAVIAWGVRRLAPKLPLWGYIGVLSPLMTDR